MTGYVLDPAMPVLSRPDGVVQVGWDPRRAVLVRPPRGLTAAAWPNCCVPCNRAPHWPNLQAEAVRRGAADGTLVTELADALVDVGVVTALSAQRRPSRTASIRIHGRGPLSDLLASSLRCSGARIRHSNLSHAGVSAATTDLVVLSDFLVADPRVVRELHAAGVAHLPVRVRDGVGLVGPLVIPGAPASCGAQRLASPPRPPAWSAEGSRLRVGGVVTAYHSQKYAAPTHTANVLRLAVHQTP